MSKCWGPPIVDDLRKHFIPTALQVIAEENHDNGSVVRAIDQELVDDTRSLRSSWTMSTCAL